MGIEPKKPAPDPPARRTMGGRRGPILKSLDDSQKKRMLELLWQGYGEQLACLVLGITPRTQRNTFEWEESFRLDVRDAIEVSRQVIEKVAHDLAMNGDILLLVKALDRIDKARVMSQVREDFLANQSEILEKAMIDVACKVAFFFVKYVPTEKLPLLLRAIPGLISEISRRETHQGH
jgi:hypothetical protein